jgi:hypothetical protein
MCAIAVAMSESSRGARAAERVYGVKAVASFAA